MLSALMPPAPICVDAFTLPLPLPLALPLPFMDPLTAVGTPPDKPGGMYGASRFSECSGANDDEDADADDEPTAGACEGDGAAGVGVRPWYLLRDDDEATAADETKRPGGGQMQSE